MDIRINSHEYKIIDNLGRIGSGTIYKVLDKQDNKYYVIKKISINNLKEDEINYIKNILNILSSINNEHIIRYFDSSKDNDNYYI